MENTGNLETFKEWKRKISTIAYIFDMTLEKYQKRIYWMESFITIFTYLSTVTSLSVLGFSSEVDTYPAAAIAIKSGAFVCTFAASIMVTTLNMTGWKKLLENGFKYLHTVEALSAKLSAIDLNNQDELFDFVKKHREEYISILSNAPDIPNSDYLAGMEAYEKASARFRNDLVTF